MSTRPVVRARILALAVGLAAGGVLSVPTAPAQAGVFDSPQLRTQVSFNAGGPGVCTGSPPGPAMVGPVPFAADGVPVTSTGTFSRTYTNNGDAGDITKLDSTMTSTVAVTGTPTSLTGIKFHSTSHSSVASTRGTAQQCGASVTTISFAQFTFDLAAPRAVVMHASGGGIVQVQFSRTVPSGPAEAVSLTLAGSGSGEGDAVKILSPGTWTASLAEQSQIAAPKPATPTTSISGDVSAEVSFTDPGVATGPATGDGNKFLKTADARTCAGSALTATWRAKAGTGQRRTVKKAVFLVNGIKAATVRKPKKGKVTTLTGLTAGKPADLEVRITLAAKGAGTVTVERSYLIC